MCSFNNGAPVYATLISTHGTRLKLGGRLAVMPLIFPSCFPTPVSPLLLLLSPHAHETGCPSCFDALYRSLVLSSMSRVWSSTIIIIIIITTTQTPNHTFHHCSHASRKIANTRTLLAPRLVFFFRLVANAVLAGSERVYSLSTRHHLFSMLPSASTTPSHPRTTSIPVKSFAQLC